MNMEKTHIITMELLLTAEAVDLVFLFITGHPTMEIQMSCFKLNKWKTPGEMQCEWRLNQVWSRRYTSYKWEQGLYWGNIAQGLLVWTKQKNEGLYMKHPEGNTDKALVGDHPGFWTSGHS